MADDNVELDSDAGGIIPRNIATEMREAYLDYAMSVITSRALPDVRDGLKPVHRRILYTMHRMGLTAGAKARKSAAVVGDVLGKYHPHGDASVYDAMVKMAQDFAMRYPLILGQGNFGCFTKDTKVQLTDGRQLTFEKLVEEEKQGKKNYTFTVTAEGSVSVAPILKPRLTIRGAELVEVELDSGERIRCTPNHKFMLKDRTYVEAQHLTSGASLMPLYTRISTQEDSPIPEMSGYHMVWQPPTNTWDFTHHLSDSFNLVARAYKPSDGRVRHHVDFDKLNNNPDNIRRMHWRDHWDLHASLARRRHETDPEYVRKLAEGRKVFWDKPENRMRNAERISERNKIRWQESDYREHMRGMLSKVNIEYVKNHPEVREKISVRMTKTLMRLWQDPAYRTAMHEKIVRANRGRLTNRTGKLKFDAVCTAVIKAKKELTADAYEQLRRAIYPYGRATGWSTGLQKYYGGDTSRVLAEIRGNHSVRSVRFLDDREDVYDLTVSDTHNFALACGVFVHNSIDGDSAAAMRYTEAKMSKISAELLGDIDKDTVNWRPNYDGTLKEPEVMPAAVPNILLNGTLGIAVGMATNIPPHNLGEVNAALEHLIDNPAASVEDLMQFVSGPDFPTGAIVFNKKDLLHAYTTGRGGVVARGNAEIVEGKKGDYQIIVTSIPYRVNKADMIVRIADLVRDKKLEGVRGLRDESTRDIRVVIELKQGAHPQKVLNYLYKHTQLEDAFHFNMVMLVDGVPQTLSLKGILQEFIKHRREVVKRRTQFDLTRAQEREHVLLGLKKALDHIDEVIKTIRASKDVDDARLNLMKKFKFSEIQANAILEMRLQKLANLERKKVEDELKEVQGQIEDLTALLKSDKKMLGVIKAELGETTKKYGDDRRTKVVKGEAGVINVEDLVADEEQVLTLSAGGYVKRTNPEEYRRQKRGGVGVIDLDTKEEDFVTNFLTTSTHSDLLFFTDIGKAYQIKMYELPEGKRSTKGKAIVNYLSTTPEEKVTSVLPMRKVQKEGEKFLYMITKKGVAKKVDALAFHDVRRSGLIAMKLQKGDELVGALLVEKGDEIALSTAKGQSIRFKEGDIRAMGRTAGGVRGMKLGSGDVIVGADVIPKGAKDLEILVVSRNGYGKTTPITEYKTQNRGGSGIKTMNVTAKTGPVIATRVVQKGKGDLSSEALAKEEIVVISKKGQVIRTALKEIPSLSRSTQGVRVMKLREGDAIASFVCL